MSDPFTTWLQSRLTAHGFAVGGIDGDFGPTTRKALGAFQRSRGLPVTYSGDGETVAALRTSASSVTPTEKAAIGDIDTPAAPSSLPAIVSTFWPRQAAVRSVFGEVGKNQVLIEPAYAMRLAWDLGTAVRRISVHAKVADAARAALEEIAGAYSDREREQLGLDRFGGSLNVRRMRGGSAYSMHSWGIALDFDPERNGLVTRSPDARLSHPDADAFWAAWIRQGALPLGKAIGRDWMHVQFARL